MSVPAVVTGFVLLLAFGYVAALLLFRLLRTLVRLEDRR